MAAKPKPPEPKRPALPPHRPVDETEVATMLRDAGAPMPWAHPDLCDNLALTVNLVAMDIRDPDPGGYDARANRVKVAIASLRENLPLLADYNQRIAAHPWEGPFRHFLTEQEHATVRQVSAEQAELMHRLHGALFQVMHLSIERLELHRLTERKPEGPRRRSPKTALPPRYALRLFNAYCAVVGHGSTEEQGNAARFISDALARAGYVGREGKPATPSAVSGALKRAGVATRTGAGLVSRRH